MSKTMRIEQLLSKMWTDYIKMNPKAKEIHDLFTSLGEKVENDHIALRTFNHKKVGLAQMAKSFLACGYQEKGEYHFPEKKLFAKHYEHENQNLPKIFISELILEEFSSKLQDTIHKLIDQIPDKNLNDFDFVSNGRPWKVTTQIYKDLLKESDYAAWVSAFGYRPNHFTVFINNLKNFNEIKELNTFLKDNGFKLNDSGGEIKGSPEVYLEQSSTIAGFKEVEFDDGILNIPACYYEFAKRYKLTSGEMYQGFVAKSADKIFESTSRGQ